MLKPDKIPDILDEDPSTLTGISFCIRPEIRKVSDMSNMHA